MSYDYLVVGAGLAGCTMAERLATQLDARVLLVDRRPHLAGNAYDPVNADGVRVHRYGPHIFHTNADAVVRYLSQFTQWRPYEHRVLARVRGQLVPIPINRTTLNALYGVALDEAGARAFLDTRVQTPAKIVTSEDAILARVGRELYELFFRGYTRKQWGLDPAELDASVCGRIPTRTNDDDRYFTDAFQAMPVDGFSGMAERMTADPRIDVALDTDYRAIADSVRFRHLVYTGPIDEYFEHRFGALPYRSLRFEYETVAAERGLPAAVVNEPSEDVPYTRTTDYALLNGGGTATTVLAREYALAGGDPFYPIPRPENRERYRKYETLARAQRNVTFVGRLAEYKYFNMDQVVASALGAFERLANGAEAAS